MTEAFREALIDLGAISANVAELKRQTGTRALAVVKADGYGHGAIPAARAALEGGADELGVVSIDEALALRDAGIDAPVLSWLHAPDADFAPAIEAGVQLGLSSVAQLERVAAIGGATVQLKVDSGLSRNGAAPDECAALFEAAAGFEAAGRLRVRGLFSHLAGAGEAEDRQQLRTFLALAEAATAAGLEPELRHIAATAGALTLPEARLDMVRLGIGIYGLSPLAGRSSASLGLRPAMRLSAAVAQVKRVPADSGVSYSFTYRTSGETTLALVPLGYADGIPRHASNAAPVAINGGRYRVSGRVAMDQFVVDVGDDAVRVGDRAVLFGDPADGVPSADDWAEASGTINYEIVTRIGGRVSRRYR